MPTPRHDHGPEQTIEVRVAPASSAALEATLGDGGVPPGWEPFVDWFCAYWIRRANRGMDERR